MDQSLKPSLTREQATKLNPLISPISLNDTLNKCSQLTKELGYIMALQDLAGLLPGIHNFTGAVCAALEF